MARKKKGELPSGNIRRQIYNGMKQKTDKHGNPMFDENGKPIMIRDYISVTATSTKEAEKEKAIAVIEKKGKQKPLDVTLREAIDNYIAASDSVLSPTTISGYRTIQNYGFRMIIDMKLSDISEDVLKKAVNAESARKTRRGTVISPKTVSNEYGLIRAVLTANKVIINANINLPQKTKRFNELSSPDVIFNMVKGTEIELPVLLAMWLSFSMSEIKGLTKSQSISADGNYIMIKEVQVRVGKKDIRKKQGKKETRNRKLRIPEYIKELIDNVETDQLVTLSGSAIYDRFTRMLSKNGLPHMTFHDLRHVNASVMAILHIPDKYAQERGGWSTDRVMKETYTQTFSKERIAVDDTIDAYFSETLFGESTNLEKYRMFLSLFSLEENSENKKLFCDFEELLSEYSVEDIINATRNATRK
jgi:integrase